MLILIGILFLLYVLTANWFSALMGTIGIACIFYGYKRTKTTETPPPVEPEAPTTEESGTDNT